MNRWTDNPFPPVTIRDGRLLFPPAMPVAEREHWRRRLLAMVERRKAAQAARLSGKSGDGGG